MIRSMFSAISGLRNHQTMMDVVGNNISNVNTNGFKSLAARIGEVLEVPIPRVRDRIALAAPARLVALIETHGELRYETEVKEQLRALADQAPRLAFARESFNEAALRYNAAIEALGNAFHELDQSFNALVDVRGDDGRPMVDARGVELRLCESWRELLSRVDEEVVIWTRTFRKAYGAAPNPSALRPEDDEADEEVDPYADLDNDDE